MTLVREKINPKHEGFELDNKQNIKFNPHNGYIKINEFISLDYQCVVSNEGDPKSD